MPKTLVGTKNSDIKTHKSENLFTIKYAAFN